MPRVLGSEQNELIIDDKLSGDKIALYFRIPTTTERQGYANMAVQRKGKKLVMRQAEAQAKYGAKILTGIGEDAFIDENKRPISSNPSSEFYREDWKEKVLEDGADLVMLLAIHVFDRSATVEAPDTDDTGE